ncbi:MAG: hypothetical protein PHE09_09595, partial [Oscillospiraceae bacterium]|nr:hypothetical protein [Oscillospiraceae bacterium]
SNFFRCSLRSGVIFLLLINKTSKLVLPFYTNLEVYTKSGTVSIGDARRVANIMYAIWDAFEVASTL